MNLPRARIATNSRLNTPSGLCGQQSDYYLSDPYSGRSRYSEEAKYAVCTFSEQRYVETVGQACNLNFSRAEMGADSRPSMQYEPS
jgi:hypothetical protein